MSYSICRIQKIKSGGVTGIQIHDRREKDAVSHTNKDIDWNRTKENIELIDRQGSFRGFVKERIKELNLSRAVRKDATVMVQALVTSDRAFFNGMNKEQQIDFLKKGYEFVKDRYGEENMVSATIHMDETTPHLHVNFVPVTKDGRLSARDLFSPKDLRKLQDDFNKHCRENGYDLKRGDKESKAKHLEIQDYKIKTKQEKLEKVEEVLTAQEIKLENKQQKLEQLEEAITTQESKLSSKQRELWEVENDLADRESKIHKLEEVISNQEGTLQIKREELQKAEEAVGVLQSDLKGLESEYKRVEGIKAQFHDIEAVEARTGLLRRSEVRMSTEDFDMLKSLAKKAPVLESRINTLEGQNTRLNSDLLKMNEMLEDLKSERAKFKKIYDEGLKKNKNMSKVIEKMNRVIKENPVLGNEFLGKYNELVEEEKIAEQAKAEEAMEKELPKPKMKSPEPEMEM